MIVSLFLLIGNPNRKNLYHEVMSRISTIAISPAKFWNRLLSTDQLDPLQNDLPQKYEAGNSCNFNSTKWFSYPSFQLKVKIIDCLQNDGTWFFSTKRLGFYVLQGSMLRSFIHKTVKKTICSEHESQQMVEDMATPIR